MRIETERLYIYPISDEDIRQLIGNEKDPELKQAYTEMLEGCLKEPEKRQWYTVWLIELRSRPGTVAGDLCFKGLGADGAVEIGYGLREGFCGNGYMTEAVRAMSEWAAAQQGVTSVEAESAPDNIPSQKVLKNAGYIPNGETGEEGPRFVYTGKPENAAVRKAGESDAAAAAELAALLWDEHSPEELAAEYRSLLNDPGCAVFIYSADGTDAGFAQCQLRHDYVEGTDSSPVGYLEGIYVREGHRRKGIAKELLRRCESWALEKGCTEFASDCELINKESAEFHAAVGFKEANRIICFTKPLIKHNTEGKRELWDAYDAVFEKIEGMTLVRGEEAGIPRGVYHLVCHVLVRHTDGTYLIMRRDTRKAYPGMWEATAGGSALKGESAYECALRELREETGISASGLSEIKRFANDETHSAYAEFLCVTDCNKDSVSLQDGETIAYRWVSREELLSMDAEEMLSARMQEYVSGLPADEGKNS